MLDLKKLRDDPEAARRGLAAKGAEALLDEVLALDAQRRALLTATEALQNERNRVSKEVGRLKAAKQDATALMERVRAINSELQEQATALQPSEAACEAALLRLPNLPDPSVPVGADAAGNQVVRAWGDRPAFDFTPLPHWELGARLGLFDFERGARLAGAGFPLLRGPGARLSRALIQFMLDLHTREHGYEEVAPPFLCNTAAMTGTGQLPKMAEDMYRVTDSDLWLIPTAEVPVTNIYREEIIRAPLPVRLTAYSPCFRREAGAAGKDTRGLNRVHQFDKVEMVKFTTPESSADELDRLVRDAEDVLQRLELPYRILELCTGDLSFAAAKCYDLELWAPGQDRWLEVSSCSNFLDFQARRARIRYKNEAGQTAFVHTLNGSGVALPRLIVAVLECGQQADGSVRLPTALRPYLGGLERLEPAS
ncbi:MAG: serine--tRNA ligase [Candidatus Marinimicrobia bacterium]|nr:serine--tRNA ligase [Candidatus Neomarinimicrobiota bacterium]